MSASATPSSRRPGRVRVRLGRALLILTGIAILGAVAVAAVWTFFGDRLAEEAARALNVSVFDADSTRIRIGKVEGNPFGRLVVHDVRLEQRAEDGWFTFLGIERAEARFDPLDFVRGAFRLHSLTADSLRFELRRDAHDRFLVPVTRGGGGDDSGDPFTLSFVRVDVTRSRVDLDLPGAPLHLRDVSGGLSILLADEVLISLDRLSGTLNDTLGVMEAERGMLRIGERFRMEDLRLDLDGARLDVTAELANDLPGGGAIRFAASELPLGDVGALIAIEHMEPGWVERGEMTLTPGPPVRLEIVADGRWDVWALDDVTADCLVLDDAFVVETASFRSRGIRFRDVSTHVPVEGTDLTVTGRFSDLVPDSVLVEIPAAAVVPGRYQGRGRVRFPDRERLLERLEVDLFLGPGEARAVPFDGGRVVAAGGEAGWRIDSLSVQSRGGVLVGRGTVDPAAIALDFRYEGPLEPFRSYLPGSGLTGHGWIAGRMEGATEAPRLDLAAHIEEAAAWQFGAQALDVVRFEGELGEGDPVHGRELVLEMAASRGVRLGAMNFEVASLTAILYDDRLDVDRLEIARGDSTVRAAGSLAWDPSPRIALDRVKVGWDGRTFQLAEPAVLTWDEGRLSANSLTVLGDTGSLSASGWFAPESRTMDARFALRDFDPTSFVADPSILPVTMASADGDFALSGAIPFLNGEGRFAARSLRVDKAGFDSLLVVGRVDGPSLVAESIRLHRGRGRIEARGEVTLPVPIYLFVEGKVFGPEPDPDSTLWNVDIEASDVRLEEWFAHLPSSRRPRGEVTARLTMRGSSARPDLGLEGVATSLKWRGIEAERLAAQLTARDGAVKVDSLSLEYMGDPILVAGTVPLAVTLDPPSFSLGEEGMDVTLATDAGSLANLRVLPWIDTATGRFRARLRLRGNPLRPDIDGSLRVMEGTIRPEGRDEVLENAQAEISFDGNLVTVLAASANLGGGTVTAVGTFRPFARETESYELAVEAKNAVVREAARYAARVSGRLRLVPRLAGGKVYPYATGAVRIGRAEYVGTLEPQDIVELREQPILYEIDLDATNRIYVRTENLDAELSADLTVRQEPDERVFRGSMEILNGTYRLFLREFRITEGTLRWEESGTELPTMDVTAETFDGRQFITIRWTGRADEPVIEFSARDPETGEDLGLSDEEIVRRLAVGSFGLNYLGVDTGEGAQSDSPEALGYLVEGSKLFVREIERAILDQVGFFDDIRISPEYYRNGRNGNQFDFRLEVRKWITPELSLRYEQGLSRAFDQDVAVEYRLGRTVILRGQSSRDRLSDQASVTREYSLDMKFRFEY